jgi:hypothetical protein
MTDATSVVSAQQCAAAVPAQALGNPASQPPRGSLTVADLVTLYVRAYKGRDGARLHYLHRWVEQIGARRIDELDEDLVAGALQHFAQTPAMRFLGRDKATGAPRWKDLGLLSPASLNRLRSTLSALLRFAKDRRLAPKGWTNPVLEVKALREDNKRIRFLAPGELGALLAACKASSCSKLYLLVAHGPLDRRSPRRAPGPAPRRRRP